MSLEDAQFQNPEDIISGHNGEKQSITVRDTRLIRDPITGSQCMERVCSDDFGNWYLVYSAQMQDGELYDVADWVKPSALQQFGGFTDDLIDAFRTKAFAAFKKTREGIDFTRMVAQAGKTVGGPDVPLIGVNLAGDN